MSSSASLAGRLLRRASVLSRRCAHSSMPFPGADHRLRDRVRRRAGGRRLRARAGATILEFECNFNDDELSIENMRILDQNNRDAENVYGGPPFQDHDESLQKALHRYLEVRGIKHSLHDWLYQYMMSKDEKEYVVWLKNMKEFVAN
ncbi:hypothetical protein ABZP36_020645 [Zizania latifolia]